MKDDEQLELFPPPEPPRKTQRHGKCRSCRANILWVMEGDGRPKPMNFDGTSHFKSCPQAQHWSRKHEH